MSKKENEDSVCYFSESGTKSDVIKKRQVERTYKREEYKEERYQKRKPKVIEYEVTLKEVDE